MAGALPSLHLTASTGPMLDAETDTVSDALSVVWPQLPKLLELVGLGYSAWFTYRYLLFKVRSTSRHPCVIADWVKYAACAD